MEQCRIMEFMFRNIHGFQEEVSTLCTHEEVSSQEEPKLCTDIAESTQKENTTVP